VLGTNHDTSTAGVPGTSGSSNVGYLGLTGTVTLNGGGNIYLGQVSNPRQLHRGLDSSR
jgi:hypothetical protein